jgi:hypothetical protein
VATLDYSTPDTETVVNDDAVPHSAIGFAITPLLFAAILGFGTGELIAAAGSVSLLAFVCFPAGVVSLIGHVVRTRIKLVSGPRRNYRWVMCAIAGALLLTDVAVVALSVTLR